MYRCEICKKRIWFWQEANKSVSRNPNMYKGKKRAGRHTACFNARQLEIRRS